MSDDLPIGAYMEGFLKWGYPKSSKSWMTILVLKPMVTWEPHILPLKNRTLPARADFLASNETTNHGRFEQKKHAAIVDIGAKVLNYTYKLVF